MTIIKNAMEEYKKRRDNYTDLLKKQTEKFNSISRLRLFVFITGSCSSILLLYFDYYNFSGLSAILSIFLFIILIFKHLRIAHLKKITSFLININSESIDRLYGKWTGFQDTGENFINHNHQFSTDLDLFGPGSLFQWINVTNTYTGRQIIYTTLTQSLKDSKKSIERINKRQEAINELAFKLDWRQKFQAEGLNVHGEMKDPESLLNWAEDGVKCIKSKFEIILLRLMTSVTFILILLACLAPGIPYYLPLISVLIQLVIIGFRSKIIYPVFTMTGNYKNIIKTFLGLLRIIEREQFNSEYLKGLKELLLDNKKRPASKQIKKLESIVDLTNLRFSSIHFFINMITLWDIHCIIALDNWKEKMGVNLRNWINAIGEFEALSSLAIIRHDNRDWAQPVITDDKYTFLSCNMSHPLLPEKTRVHNDLNIKGSGNILIITGSNMSGKSTLLRTVGINLVLAYAGAPVCADSLTCSIMDIYSSMRVNDNLENNISTFYAELLRIKMIIDASRKEDPLIFLLDEIFHGTNSRDRKIGAKTVLKNLSRQGVIGLVSTHDLELTELEEEKGLSIKNYYFRENYKDEQIFFDYILREGVSDTSDAIFLMKMIGIDVDD